MSFFEDRFPFHAFLFSLSQEGEHKISPNNPKRKQQIFILGPAVKESLEIIKKLIEKSPEAYFFWITQEGIIEDCLAFDEIFKHPHLHLFSYKDPMILAYECASLGKDLHIDWLYLIEPSNEWKEFSKVLTNHYILYSYAQNEAQNRAYIIRNILANLADSKPWSHLNKSQNYFKNKPLIIVGAGSSLDKYLPYIKEKNDKLNIMALGSSLGILFDEGIKCDMGVMVCPNSTSLERLEGKVNSKVLFTTLRCHSKLFLDFENTKVVIPQSALSRFSFLHQELKPCPVINSMPEMSSTSLALGLAVAQYLGFNPIILVGVDLGYNQKKYAGNIESDWEEERFLPELEVLETQVSKSFASMYRLGDETLVKGILPIDVDQLDLFFKKEDKIDSSEWEKAFELRDFSQSSYLEKIKTSFKTCKEKWDLPLREVHLEEELAYQEFLCDLNTLDEVSFLDFSS
jgi:hypothetical protein